MSDIICWRSLDALPFRILPETEGDKWRNRLRRWKRSWPDVTSVRGILSDVVVEGDERRFGDSIWRPDSSEDYSKTRQPLILLTSLQIWKFSIWIRCLVAYHNTGTDESAISYFLNSSKELGNLILDCQNRKSHKVTNCKMILTNLYSPVLSSTKMLKEGVRQIRNIPWWENSILEKIEQRIRKMFNFVVVLQL